MAPLGAVYGLTLFVVPAMYSYISSDKTAG